MSVNGYWFDYASALCAAVSAFFWAWSARIKIPTGYDVGLEQKEAFKKVGRLNAVAASFAALAAAIPALKAFGGVVGMVNL